jgi:hypothetical protein
MPETPRHGHEPVPMRHVVDEDRYPHQVGDFWWDVTDGRRCLVVVLPIKGSKRGLRCEFSINHKNHCNAQWAWDGNVDAPTLTPSLHAVGHWHGWVRNGQLVEA